MRATNSLLTAVLSFSVVACVAADARVAPATPPVVEVPPPPVVAPAPVSIPREVALASEILRAGAEAVTDEWTDGDGAWQDNVFFRELRKFLESPAVGPAVQPRHGGFGGDDVEFAPNLTRSPGGTDERAVVSLAALVRVRAPKYIVKQWECLARLQERHGEDPAWNDVLRELRAPFAPAAIDAALCADPPTDPYADTREIEWAVRAAGVTRHAGAIPRLVELAANGDFRVAPAAERSLEDFPGSEIDDALVECLLSWRSGVSERAGSALAKRDPDLLRGALVGADVPEHARYEAGMMLASLGSSAAVPHLCAEVGRIGINDGAMFDAIARLATARDLPLVDALPSSVRKEQQARAKSVVAAVHARLDR